MNNYVSMSAEKPFIQNIRHQLVDFYEGSLWVTEAFKTKVAPLPGEIALWKKPPFVYSIAGQVAHMAAWRNFVHQKIVHNDGFDIEDNSPQDWPPVNDWREVLKTFEKTQEYLLTDLHNFEAGRLDAIVPGRSYNFAHLLNGLVQHDLYHYGQIGTILAVIKR
jgi:uncharacterized damage-inducible protein DinB